MYPKNSIVAMDGKFAEEFRSLVEICKATKASVDKIMGEIEGLRRDNEENKAEINILKEENEALNIKLNELEQYGKKSNLIIQGVSLREGENLKEITKKLARKLEVNIDDADIAKVHRLPTRKNHQVPPIIVRLNNLDKRDSLFSNAKRIKPQGKDIGLESPNPIFVDEHLTRETLKIWMYAKRLQREGWIFSAKCREGKIKIRKVESSRPIRILSTTQLDHIKEEMETIKRKEADSKSTTNKRNIEQRSPDYNSVTNQDQRNKIQKQQGQGDQTPWKGNTSKQQTIEQSFATHNTTGRRNSNSSSTA